MKKVFGTPLVIFFIIVISIIVFIGVQPPKNQSIQVPITNLPKDVPIVKGNIISTKAVRSDDLTRGIVIEVETDLSLKEVVLYYKDEFAKRGTLTETTIQGDAREIENFTNVDMITESKSHLGMVVSAQTQSKLTLVRIQIKGNSILFLPS